MRELANVDPQRAREFVEAHVLAEWGRAVADQRAADADRFLALSRVVAASIGARGNRSLPEQVALIEGATTDRRETLARAHVRFGESLLLYDGVQPASALEGFSESRSLFEQVGSPYRLWAGVHEMAVRYLRGELPAATAAAGRLRATPDIERYPAIDARLAWAEGLFAANAGRLQDALAHGERAARVYSALGERENGVFLKTLTAEALEFVGDEAQAWRYRVEALRDAMPARNPRRPHTTWVNAGIAATRQGMPGVAVHLQNEAVALSESHGQPILRFEAHLYRARARAASGDTSLALEDLRIAEDLLPDLPAAVQPRMKTEVLVTHGMLPGHSADALSRTAASWLAEAGSTVRVPQLLHSAATARMARGDVDGALQDLTTAIDAAAGQVPRAVESLRWAYADTLWPLFRQAAMLHLARGDIAAALQTAEKGTMRLPTQALASDAAWPRLPNGVIAVRFLVSDTRSFAIVLGASDTRAVELGAGLADLERDALRFRLLTTARSDRSTTDAVLADLGRRWVAPWIDLVREGATLALIPDGPLHHVSFAALRLADGRYLAQRNPIEIWGDLTARAQEPTPSSARAMVAVGIERFDHTGFPSLRRLPRALDEAVSIGLQHRETALVGDQATPAAIVPRLARARVAHFATHALANPEFPNLSWIALAPDEAHPRGLWFASEIRQQALHQTELVYLSACDGSAGQLSRAEGAASLARAFLDAGVATVIASGWTVDDGVAGRLSRAFYAAYLATGDATASMNAAQQSLITDAEAAASPLSWSSMQVFTRNRLARPTS
jgi:CHAT domain-containing protein